MWDFYTNTCSSIGFAQTYPCTFDGLTAAVANLGFPTANLTAARSAGAKLVACGELITTNAQGDPDHLVVGELYTPPAGQATSGCSFVPSTSTLSLECDEDATNKPDAPPGDGTVPVQDCLH
jgi:hypothetical protein